MIDLIACGESLIDMIPEADGCFRPHPGGAPANVAVGGTRLGLSTAFIGKRGTDLFGETLDAHFAHYGVDRSGFISTQEAKTALAFIQYRNGQGPFFSFYRDPGADELLQPQDLPTPLLTRTRALHFGSISLYSEPAASATRAAVDKVLAGGGLVTYDPNLRPAIMATRPGALEAAYSALPRVHAIKVSAEELLQLTGMANEDQALAHIFDKGVRLTAITRGSEGATLVTTRTSVAVPGEVVTLVDATGAGDAFVAGLVSGLLERDLGPEDLEGLEQGALTELAQWANRIAALSTTKEGATEGLVRPS